MQDMMLKTLTAMDAEIMGGYAVILPTPNAVEAEKYTKTYNEDSQMGRSLTAMAVNGLLPTPLASDGMNRGVRTIKGARKERPGLLNISDMASLNLLPTPLARAVQSRDSKDGKTSQLNPLFVGEMMGFPLEWLTLPFLSESGEKKL